MWTRLLARLSIISPLEQRVELSKGGAGKHHGDQGGLFIEPLAEPNEKYIDELAVVNGIAEFAELIGHLLDPLAIHTDEGGALGGVAELSVEAVDPGVDVVLEELVKGHPQGNGGDGVTENEIEDLGGLPCVDPLDDGEFIFYPVRNRVGGNMAK
jgi:hypothetical protein